MDSNLVVAGGTRAERRASGSASRRFLLTRREAARALGMSLSHFQRHVQPFIRCVYSGQLRLYRPGDLERWSEAEAREPSRR